MNVKLDRDLFAQLVIVTAIVIGGWLMFVDSGAREVARLRQDLAQRRAEHDAASGAATREQLVDRIASLRGRVADIVARNRLGDDTTRLYSTVRDLADAHGIALRRLQPGRGTPGRSVASTEIEMHFESGVDELASFVDAVESLEGFVRPEALTLTPLEPGRVSARYAFSVLQFPLEDALVQLEAGHAGS